MFSSSHNNMITDAVDTSKIIADIDSSTLLLTEKVKGISFDDFNFRSEKGVWSIGDCIEHVVIIEKSGDTILRGPSKVYNREYDLKISVIKNAFGDETKKFIAAAIISPTPALKKPEEIIPDFIDNREKIKEIIMKFDLTQLCDAYRHPLFGHMTRLEWIYYIIYHSNRHVHQIERILKSIH